MKKKGTFIVIGTAELIVILCIVLLLFGGKKLPELAKSLGKGAREFKRACQGLEEQGLEEEESNQADRNSDHDHSE